MKKPLRHAIYFRAIACGILWFWACRTGTASAADWEFTAPECITTAFHPPDAEPETGPYHLLDNYRTSRNAGSQMAFDSEDRLHLTYWSGYANTFPDSPSAIFHQSWSKTDGWSDQVVVDQSYSTDPLYLNQRMGGRHPSLAIAPNDTIWIAWHDFRHCTVSSPANGIDNIEIYCNSKRSTGSFQANDIRLTETNTPNHNGDNGYLPQIRAAADGRISVLWYDFHLKDTPTDLYMITSDPEGVFDTSASLLSQRLTKGEDRGSIINAPSFSIADLAIGPDGQRYAVWAEGFGGSIGNNGTGLFFAELPQEPAFVNHQVIATNHDGFWYPAKIRVSASNDLWVAYTLKASSQSSQIMLMRRRAGQAAFDSPIALTVDGQHRNADLAIDGMGRLHLVWEEYIGFQNSLIRYALLGPDGLTRLREELITPESGAFAGPCIKLNREDLPHVVYGEGNTDSMGNRGEIWFARAMIDEQPAAVGIWTMYE